jgi:hypothetical protein
MFRRLVSTTALTLLAASAQAALIQGPASIHATTSMATCGAFCSNVGTDINQIADGDTSNFNGWAGANNLVGTIQLDLLGSFDLTSFSLWNDINVLREGVGDFQLHYYDAADQLIGDSAIFTAPISQFAAGVYNLGLVQNVSRVDLEVKTLLTGGVCCRIEIREVAFNGEPAGTGNTVPEPTGALLAGLGLAVLAGHSRLRRSR